MPAFTLYYCIRVGDERVLSIEIHTFDPESLAKKTRIRRANESEIIASRQPKFNVRP
ncbi:hypothetical protein ACFL2H_02155 [Planctomycetota bacterium]